MTSQAWFWPLIGICLALVLSVLSTIIVLAFVCYTKHKSTDHSDESDERSETDSYSSLADHANHHRASPHTERFHSPPPPYTSSEPPPLNFLRTSPQLPAYEPQAIEVPPAPATVIENVNRPTATTEISSTLTNPSIQTFQV